MRSHRPWNLGTFFRTNVLKIWGQNVHTQRRKIFSTFSRTNVLKFWGQNVYTQRRKIFSTFSRINVLKFWGQNVHTQRRKFFSTFSMKNVPKFRRPNVNLICIRDSWYFLKQNESNLINYLNVKIPKQQQQRILEWSSQQRDWFVARYYEPKSRRREKIK